MPRTGPGKKPANPHNNRHENGLVGPGKRIVKQKSNGHLNGSPRGRSQSNTPPLPAPSTGPPLTLGDDNIANGALANGRSGVHVPVNTAGLRPRDNSLSFENGDVAHPSCNANGTVFQAASDGPPLRQTDINPTKADAVYTGNPVRLASSILRACPVHDTIALLILLLHFPPALVTILQYSFAALSLLPQTVNPLAHLLDISKDSPGAPAWSTVLLTSGPAVIVILMTWTSLQNFLLDVAQVQIAIMFGGGYSEKSSSLDSALVCFFVVSATHLLQNRGVRHFLSDYMLSSWMWDYVRPHVPPILLRLLEPLNTPATRYRQNTPNWVRVAPAGHILASAVLHIVRRWLFKKNMNQNPRPSKSRDTEASAGSNQDLSDAPTNVTSNVAPYPLDAPLGSSPHKILENRERQQITKKRRRKQTLVQSQQPFWALLGRTKVNLVRHNEHSRSAPGSSVGPFVDGNVGDGMSSLSDQGHAWICGIDSTSFTFELFCPLEEADERNSKSTFRTTPPFYVRINGANWASTSIYPKALTSASASTSTSNSDDDGPGLWTGEVTGLAPNGIYQCSMVLYQDDKEFCFLNLKTPAAPDAEHTSSVARETLRPDSPTTTMQNSIAAAEIKLNEARARVKRGKRDHKNAVSSIKKETESLANRLNSSGGGDEKQKQKSLQLSQDIRRAEETCDEINFALRELATIPEEELREWDVKKSTHNTEKRSLLSARDEFNSGRQSCESALNTAQQELSHVQKQLEKAKKYQSKLKEQYDSIAQAKELGLSEKERKANEQRSRANERKAVEKTITDQMQSFELAITAENLRTQSAWNHVRLIEQQQQAALAAQAAQAAQQHQFLSLQQTSGPLTPEGNLPGTNHLATTNTRPSFMFPFPSLGGPSALEGPLAVHSQPSPRLPFSALAASARARERSNSIRSGRSAFSDFSDADPIPPMPGGIGGMEDGFLISPRRNSSSGNNSSNGQQPSPVSLGRGSPGMWK